MPVKKKLLIISALYLRTNTIGSVRPRKLAKYLSATGRYDITVLTAVNNTRASKKDIKYAYNPTIIQQEQHICKHVLIPQPNTIAHLKHLWNKLQTIKSTTRKNATGSRSETLHSSPVPAQPGLYPRNKPALLAEYTLNLLDDMIYCHRAKKAIRKQKMHETDIVFSTYGPVSCHYIARCIKQKNPGARWIADFRDPVYNDGVPAPFRTYAKNFTKKKCRTANAITAAFQGVIDSTDMPDVPSYVITNGYDPDEAPTPHETPPQTHPELSPPAPAAPPAPPKLTITYSGTYLAGKHSLAPLFRAIRELIDEGQIDETKIRIEYAGASGGDISRQLAGYNLQNIYRPHGFVTRDKALEIQANSDILIAALWTAGGIAGQLPAKLIEYMMMKKPVISITAGAVTDNPVKNITQQCSLGICYEEAQDETDYPKLKDYISTQYKNYRNHGKVIFEPNSAEIDKYSYPNIARQMEKTFLEAPV